MAFVYILYSNQLDRYYIGSCLDLELRIEQHSIGKFTSSFTTKAHDFFVYFIIENLSYKQARLIERHIKKMRNRTYLSNLKKYSDIVEKLKKRYL